MEEPGSHKNQLTVLAAGVLGTVPGNLVGGTYGILGAFTGFTIGYGFLLARDWTQNHHGVRSSANVRLSVEEYGPTYGHPRPPVQTLLKKLPKPPPGYMFEVSVNRDDPDDPILVCSLRDVASGKTVESASRSLVHRSDKTIWQRLYASCEEDGHKDTAYLFFDELMNSFTRWAATCIKMLQVDDDTIEGSFGIKA